MQHKILGVVFAIGFIVVSNITVNAQTQTPLKVITSVETQVETKTSSQSSTSVSFNKNTFTPSSTCAGNLTPESSWQIDNFKTDVFVAKDGSLSVQETITANFFVNKHGIYRYIPLVFEPGGQGFNKSLYSSLNVGSINVLLNGQPVNYETSYLKGNCTKNLLADKKDWFKVIKIGDANVTITGQNTYQINYTINGILRDDRQKYELYFNAIPHFFTVPIKSAQVNITLDGDLVTKNVYCYKGSFGSTNSCEFTKEQNSMSLNLASDNGLNAFEGVTLLATIQNTKNADLLKNNVSSNYINILLDLWYYPLAVLPLLYALINLIKTRSVKPSKSQIVEFSAPNNLSSAMTGYLFDQKINTQDLASLVLALAVKGYVKIVEKKEWFGFVKGYQINKIANPTHTKPTTEDEQILLGGMFEKGDTFTVSAPHDSFYKTIESLNSKLTNIAKTQGYLTDNPNFGAKIYIPIYLIFGLNFLLIVANADFIFALICFPAAIATLILMLFFSFYTQKGADTLNSIKGLREYIKTAEKDKIKYLNAPQMNPEFFERLLPYAMSLGVLDIWVSQFKNIITTNPNWYQSTDTNFVFVNSFSSNFGGFNSTFSSSIKVATAANNRSYGGSFGGGGGFSGGGGGGGGGGSW